jgi:hypothetical protein
VQDEALLDRLLVAGALTLIAAFQALVLRLMPGLVAAGYHGAALTAVQRLDARFAVTAICLYFGLVAWYYLRRKTSPS